MILNKKYFALSGMALLATVFVACNDDDPTEVYVGNMPKYQKAYITTGVSQPNGAVFEGSYPGELQFTDEGKPVYVHSTTMVPSGSFETDVYFRTTYAVKKAISGTIDVVPDAEEFVARYNTEHQTACKLLPASFYALEDTRATIEAGSKSSEGIHVTVHTDLDWEPGEYLLPLAIMLDKGADIGLSEEKSTLCLKYIITSSSEYFLTSDDFDLQLSSGSTVTPIENAFDADRSTLWSTSSTTTCDVLVTFKEPHYVSRICVVDCSYVYYTWMSYEETPSTFFGGNYTWGENPGFSVLNPASNMSYNASRKVKCIKIRNYRGNIADIYFLVKD